MVPVGREISRGNLHRWRSLRADQQERQCASEGCPPRMNEQAPGSLAKIGFRYRSGQRPRLFRSPNPAIGPRRPVTGRDSWVSANGIGRQGGLTPLGLAMEKSVARAACLNLLERTMNKAARLFLG